MKVTRAIREFIEQQVEIKANQILEPLKKKRDEAMANAAADIVKAETEMNAMFKVLLDKYGVQKGHLSVRCPQSPMLPA